MGKHSKPEKPKTKKQRSSDKSKHKRNDEWPDEIDLNKIEKRKRA